MLFLSLTLSLSLWLSGCGGSSHHNIPSISVSPTTAQLLVGQSATLNVSVQNVSDTRVSWSVQEVNGGTIAAANSVATYTAPWPVGTYHVTVTSVPNPRLTATATFKVSAAFAFIEEYPASSASPFSMTPKVGTFDPSGNLTISDYIDIATGKPVSVAMGSVAVSSDGAMATFDIETQNEATNTWDVYSATASGNIKAVQLTANGTSYSPQFSFDRRQILYINDGDIWMMNADGTNQHVVYPAASNSALAYSATLSPDGTKIAAELEWSPDGTYHDGIAIMNADGSGAAPLTGGSDFPCRAGWDEMPAFTNAGSQIMFSRSCNDNSTERLYRINTDGTGLVLMLNAAPTVLHYNPIAVGEKIVFQTNQDYPGTSAFEIYSMNADGSGMSRLTNNTMFDGFDTNLWGGSSSLANSQLNSKAFAARRALHGVAARAARILNQRQHRR